MNDSRFSSIWSFLILSLICQCRLFLGRLTQGAETKRWTSKAKTVLKFHNYQQTFIALISSWATLVFISQSFHMIVNSHVKPEQYLHTGWITAHSWKFSSVQRRQDKRQTFYYCLQNHRIPKLAHLIPSTFSHFLSLLCTVPCLLEMTSCNGCQHLGLLCSPRNGAVHKFHGGPLSCKPQTRLSKLSP